MCGISGYFGQKYLDDAAINQTLKLMHQRGPDHKKAVRLQAAQNSKINLLFFFFFIIDLDEKFFQFFIVGKLSLIFIGEIYNFN